MNRRKIYFIISFVATLLLTQSSCIKEYTNPSAITNLQVVSSVDGLTGLVNGLQFRYSVGRQSPLYEGFSASGLVTNELKVLNLGNTDELNLGAGLAAVLPNNSIVNQLWTQSYAMMNESNLILDNINIVADANMKAVISGYGSFYKAMALGTLATYFEKMPLTVGKSQVFSSREDALKSAISLLESAESGLSSLSSATIATLSSGRFVPGFDLKNSVIALQARFNLMLKDYTKALAAANKVDLKVKSAFRFDAVNANPVYFVSYSNRNVLEPTNKNLGLPTALVLDTLDKRIPFYLNPAASGTVNLGFGHFRSNTTDIPVYLPGEMILIKAECLAQSDIAGAIAQLNNVIKKKATEDAWGIGADIAAGYTGAATKDAVLTEIYRQRCIELCNSGLRLDDSRRLGRPGPDQAASIRERGRNFFPYPQAERDNNSNTPTDPTL
ncbi:MAG: RagB/SusD family nutrient uptake outer membrane protein [Saprospiraceae bacterium]|nr:RagB/SusD family nutrient uptake outer membrane protein [Saprospiraceae bacterium]